MFPSGYWPIAGATADAVLGDHGAAYALMSNVETGTYKTLADAEIPGIKAIRSTLTKADYLSSTFAISQTDVPWFVWNRTLGGETLEVNAQVYLRSTWWVIVGIAGERGDSAQTRIITRKKR